MGERRLSIMKKQFRVWIHCRISMGVSKSILEYQKSRLIEYAIQNNMKIVGITKLISNGKHLEQFEVHSMLTAIRRQEIDIILVYSSTRISIYPDVYDEFVLFCEMHNVKVHCISKHS